MNTTCWYSIYSIYSLFDRISSCFNFRHCGCFVKRKSVECWILFGYFLDIIWYCLDIICILFYIVWIFTSIKLFPFVAWQIALWFASFRLLILIMYLTIVMLLLPWAELGEREWHIIISSVFLYKYVFRKPVIVAILYLLRHVMIMNFYLYWFKKTLVLDKYSFDKMLYIYIPRHVLKTG